jgi:hypothetical protein
VLLAVRVSLLSPPTLRAPRALTRPQPREEHLRSTPLSLALPALRVEPLSKWPLRAPAHRTGPAHRARLERSRWKVMSRVLRV